jgi:hypothetical protein
MEDYLKAMREFNFNHKKQINLSGFSGYVAVSTTNNRNDINYIQKGVENESKNNSLKDRISDKEDLEQIEYLIEDLKEEGVKIDENGYITVYHNLSKYNKKPFEKTGELGGGSNGIIFSTKKDGKIKGYGEKVLEFKIPIEKFVWAGSFKNEVLLKIPFKSSYKKINVKKYLVK